MIMSIAALIVGFTAGYIVTSWKYEKVLKDQAIESNQTLSAAIESTKAAAKAEADRRVQVAVSNAAKAAASNDARHKGQLHALQIEDRDDCRWSDDSIRMLNDSIDAANR